jgi:hypothetical protein
VILLAVSTLTIAIAFSSVITVMAASARLTHLRTLAETAAPTTLAEPGEPLGVIETRPARGGSRSNPPRTRRWIPLGAGGGVLAGLVLAFAVGSLIESPPGAGTTGALPTGTSTPAATANEPPPTANEPPPTDVEPTVEPGGGRPPTSAVLSLRYEAETMRVTRACKSSVSVDVDEPRAQSNATDADLFIGSHCPDNYPTIRLNADVRGSYPKSSQPTSADCLNAIQAAPLPAGATKIRQGDSVCILTSASSANAQGTEQKLALLNFPHITNSAVTITATAWTFPH